MDITASQSLVFADTAYDTESTGNLDLKSLEKCKKGDVESIEKTIQEGAYYKNRKVRIQFKLFCQNNPNNTCVQILQMFYHLNTGRLQKAKLLQDYIIKVFDSNFQDKSKLRPAIYYFVKGGWTAVCKQSSPSLELAIQACAGAPECIYKNNPIILSQKLLLGTSYYHGEGVKQDLQKAKEYFMGILGSSSRAAYRLGKMAQKENKDEEAIAYYKCAAPCLKTRKLDLDNDWYKIKSHYALGALYKKNTEKKGHSTEHYCRAAEAGHPLAQYEYGKILIADKNNIKCYKAGLKWLQKAAEQGLQKAKILLDKQETYKPKAKKGSWLSHLKKEITTSKEKEEVKTKKRLSL
jgi:TPR repeat protein